jgi:hypothetical protein
MDIPKTKGYTCFVKIAESALEGNAVKARKYIEKFIIMYPESDLIYPFTYLLNGVKNPDGLTLDNLTHPSCWDNCTRITHGKIEDCQNCADRPGGYNMYKHPIYKKTHR